MSAAPSHRAWLAVCGLHGVASLLLWQASADTVAILAWRADHWIGQPWTLWTSAWVHLNTPHLIGNLLALGALAAFGWLARPGPRCAIAWLLAWPLLQLSLLLWPQIRETVVGLSGLLHAGVAVLAMQLVSGRIPMRGARYWGMVLALGVLAKTVLERAWSHPVVWDPASEMPVVQATHLSGAAWGLALGLAVASMPRWRDGDGGFSSPQARA